MQTGPECCCCCSSSSCYCCAAVLLLLLLLLLLLVLLLLPLQVLGLTNYSSWPQAAALRSCMLQDDRIAGETGLLTCCCCSEAGTWGLCWAQLLASWLLQWCAHAAAGRAVGVLLAASAVVCVCAHKACWWEVWMAGRRPHNMICLHACVCACCHRGVAAGCQAAPRALCVCGHHLTAAGECRGAGGGTGGQLQPNSTPLDKGACTGAECFEGRGSACRRLSFPVLLVPVVWQGTWGLEDHSRRHAGLHSHHCLLLWRLQLVARSDGPAA